jgi:D-alanyl-D-alanine carboxypeptidase/D-alanyl-D-alanine-endopeptidase (penicillin-binding protein 4)
MEMGRVRGLFFIVFLFLTSNLLALSIPDDLAQEVSTIPIDKYHYSIYIKSLNSDEPIASWMAHQKRTPASVIKILTTYAGVLGLGLDYRWDTQFLYQGKIKRGVLYGDFYIKASGDPTLATKDIDEIVSQIRNSGIRKIKGNIIIDRTLFSVGSKNSSGFDRNVYSPYNAMPDAIMFNKRQSTFCITPHGKRVRISKDVPDKSYKIVNKLRIVNGSCRRGRSWPRVSIKTNSSQRSTIFLSGKLSKRCGKRTICKVVSMPHRAFYYALRDGLKKGKIGVTGALKLKKTPKNAKYLFSHYSEPLEEVIATITKKSDNLMARQLFLTLGAKLYGAPSTTAKSRKAVERILNRYHILEPGTTFISNGSGLSRRAKLTAISLANLLEHAEKNYGQRWMETLSVAGIDGTIHRRFANSVVYGRAWMKTGTIKGVKNIAGYVDGASGERYVVVVLVNDKYSRKYGAKLANKVIEWVANNL